MRGKFKLFSIFLFLAMIFSFFVSSQNVFAGAPANLDGYNYLQFTGSGISDITTPNSSVIIVNYANGNTVEIKTTLMVNGGGAKIHPDSNNHRIYYKLEENETLTITANPSEGYISELKKDGVVPIYDDGLQRGVSFSFNSLTAGNMAVEAIFRECKQIEIGSHFNSDCKITSMEGERGGNSVTINFDDDNKIVVSRIIENENKYQYVPVEDLNGSGLYPYIDTSGETPKYFIRGSAGDAGLVGIRVIPTNKYLCNLWVNDYGFMNGGAIATIDEEVKFEGLFMKRVFVYFVWLDNDNNLCYHKISNFTGQQPNSLYNINNVNVNNLIDDSGHNHNYEFGQQPAGWVLAKDMEDENGNIKINLTKEYVFGNGQDNAGILLDPLGAVNGANSICTNGGGNFKATIYRDGYTAVDFINNLYIPVYLPDFWDYRFFPSRVDISDTTPENPAVFKTHLMNVGIDFKKVIIADNSLITSIRPIDVDQDVVEISVSSNGVNCFINFKSNYYDHAVLEITTEDNNKYYVRIERVAFNITSEGEGDNKKVLASFYYPNSWEWTSSCDDFDVVATKVNKDGTTEVIVVEPDADKKDLEGGRSLKKSQYTVDVDDNVEGVYFTALRKGGADAGQVEYAGTFSGSGRGIYYDLNNKQMKYDD